EDDSEAAVRRRLEVYAAETMPLLEYYRSRRLLTGVAGEGSPEEIGRAIRRAAAGDHRAA
ncbi:MAG: adenylate kinase, partial [Candidatus Methylomirabilales bacterium]